MGKEGDRSFLFNNQGKINLALILSLVFLFVMVLMVVDALTIELKAGIGSPGNHTFNSSRSINFTFNVTAIVAGETVPNNCSLWTNETGTWAERQINNSVSGNLINQSVSNINYTFSITEGNISWNIGCWNVTAGAQVFLAQNMTVMIDNSSPDVVAESPNGVLSAQTQLNITSYGTAAFYVNVSDNTTQSVWVILNDQPSLCPQNCGDTNESNKRIMTLDTSFTSGTSRYNISIASLLNFSNNWTGPGPHSVFFCANDTFGRATCSSKYDFVIKGMNVSEMERQFETEIQNTEAGFAFSGLNITYGNGTEIPFGTFMDPSTGNFTFNLQFSSDSGVFIVGGRIDESQFANASRTNYSAETTTQAQEAVGTGFDANLTWVDIKSFIPDEVSYEFGIIQMPSTYNKVMYCNGTSPSNPNCMVISQCNSSNIGLFNYTEIIPPSSPGPHACYLTSGQWGEEPVTLASGFTYIFARSFSGGLGGNDRSQPNVTFNIPRVDINNRTINISAVVTQVINFTIDDVDSTGLNLTKNNSINLTITLGGSTVAFFNYTNVTSETRLSCTTSDTYSWQNTTSVWCNATYSFNSDGTYVINVTGRDTGNNSNVFNVTTSYFTLTIDRIAPVVDYFNITQNATFNVSGYGDASALGNLDSMPTDTGVSWAQGRQLFAIANFTDNLTQVFQGALQAYNASGSTPGWVTVNESWSWQSVGKNESNWINLSFTIPTGHNMYEGANISFRIIANDTVGNKNDSITVRNITIQINDTTKPTLVISSVGGQTHVNGTNTSDPTPTIIWNVTEGNSLNYIAIQIDSLTDPNCGGFKNYSTPATANANRNSSTSGGLTVLDTGGCTALGNGTHTIRLTAEDSWGNSELYIHTFTVETGTPTIRLRNLSNGNTPFNNSNVTPDVGIGLNITNGGAGTLETLTWTSSCNTSTQTVADSVSDFPQANDSVIYPFKNISSCANTEAYQTVTITVTDTAGNSKSELYQFMVDGVGPTLTVNTPTDGSRGANNISINLTARDGVLKLSAFGYYLDNGILTGDFNSLNLSSEIGEAATSVTTVLSRNFTAGRHTIKFTVNDTLGNVKNSSVNTITVLGPISFAELQINKTLRDYNANISLINLTNASGYQIVDARTVTDQTLSLFMALNATNKGVNLTIIFNASAANWDLYNFSVVQNHSTSMGHIENNWTAIVLDYIYINDSISEFIPAANYYGKVRIPVNASNVSGSSYTLGNVFEIWYFADETDLTTRTNNIEECAASFSPTNDLTPCWNNTDNRSVDVFVPSFSIVTLVNSSASAPTITINTPSGNQTVSHFMPNITVSADAISCYYKANGTTNTQMTLSGTICTADAIGFKNLQRVKGYNITYNVTDEEGNTRVTVVNFNVSDSTKPNTPNSSRVTVSSITSSGATITITSNESVNANVSYGTTLGSLSSVSLQTDFETTQAVALVSLSASTLYYFNVTICDFNNNCVKNGTFNFTTSAAATTTTTTTTTTTSGGGGGTTAVSTVADSKSQIWSKIPAGSSFSLDVDKATIAITRVAVNDVKSELKNVDLEVQALKENPVSTEAASKVYQYLRINKKNVKDTDAESLKIGFRVTKAWLTENGLASGDISLYRYKSGWNELVTRVTGTDSTYVNYEADTPGFSSFAIGVKSGVVAGEEEAPAEEEVPAEVPEEVAPPEAVETPKPVEAPSKAPIAWIIALVVVILGIILIVAYQKKKGEV
jgi:PGF-pre-PGF domain-containing protein